MSKTTFDFLSQKRYIFFLIAAFSILLICASIFYYFYEKSSIRKDAIIDLRDFSELKINQIQNWNNEKLADANAIVNDESFAKSVESFLKVNSSYNEKIIKDQLSLIKSNIIYRNIILASPNGKLLISFNPNLNHVNPKTIGFINKAVDSKKIIMGDIYYSQSLKEINIDYIAPIKSKNRKVIAVLVLRIDPQTYLYPLINSKGSNSSQYKTILVKKEGNEVCYLNNIEGHANSELNFKISLNQKNMPSVKAILGFKGITDGVDYLGNKVLAHVAPIKGTNWFLEVKVDKSTLYYSLNVKVFFIALFNLLSILVFGFVLSLIYQSRQKNIYMELFVKEKELREYHEEFRTILYSIGDGVITTDTLGKINKMNHVAEELTGWTEAEAVGKPIEIVFNIINGTTRAIVENPIFKVLEKGIIVGLANHTLLISKDGREFPIADSGAPIRDEEGNIEGVVLIFRDKSEEHKAEKIIRQNEARLKRAELASKSGNWELHLDSKKIIASEGAGKIYGVDWTEVDYDLVKKVPLPEYRVVMDKAIINLIEDNIPYNIEYKIKALDTGEIKDIHSIAEYDKENKILFGVIHDITEQKKLEQSRFQLLNIIDKSLNEIYIFNSDTLKFEYVNNGALENLGYNAKEILSLTPLNIKPEFTEESFKQLIKPLINGENEKLVFETIHRRKNGTKYNVEIHLQLHKFEDRSVFFAIVNDITKRKRDEAALRENEAFLNNLIETIPIPVFYKDNNLKYISANNAFINLFGFTKEQIKGKAVTDLYEKELAQIYIEQDKTLINSGGLQIYESKFKDINGSNHDVIFYKATYSNSENNNAGIIGAMLDITDRKKAEEEIRTILKTTIDGFYLVDMNGRILDTNDSYCSMIGYSRDELLNMSIKDVEVQDTEDVIKEKIREIKQKGFYRFESKHKRKDGKIIDIESSVNYLKTGNEKIFVFMRDITERKKAEEEIRTVLRTTIDGFYLVDMNGKILDTNDSYCSMIGYSREELLNMRVNDIDLYDNENDVKEKLKIIKSKGFFRFETKHRRKDGKIIDIDASVNYLKAENEKVFVFMRDITERKQAEEAILRNKERWESLFNNSPAAIAIYQAVENGNDFIFTDFNSTAQKIDNINRDLVMGKRISELFPSAEKLGFLDIFRKVWQTGKTEYINLNYQDDRIEGWRENIIYRLNTGEIVSIYNDITDRMKAEISLRESEERFRTVYNASPDGISISEIETGLLVQVNDAYKSVFGFSQEEVKGKTSLEIGIWVNNDDRKLLIDELMKNGLTNNKEINFKKKDGKIIHTLVSVRVITIDQKKYMITVVKDITEIHNIGQALRESEERLKTTLYSIGDGVITTDRFGRVNRMNPVAENLTGWKESDANGKSLEEVFKIINEGTRNTVESPVHKVLKEGHIVGLANHTLLISKSGVEIPIADSGAPIRNVNGEIDGVVLVFRDQLKERAAQKILEESEAQLKQSQKVARIGYYIFDITTGFWTSSEMLDEIFGIDNNYKHDIEGWLNLIDQEYSEEMSTYLNQHILEEKKDFDKIYKIRKQNDNSVLWVHGMGSLEFDKDGNVIKMFGTIQDVTERMVTQTLIENSLKEKEVLLKEIHHRVKNNFQQIIALIALQSQFIEDQAILDIFDDLSHRLLAMSLIHELMYGTGNFVAVDIKEYIERLSNYLVQTYSSANKIKLNLDLESHSLSLDTIIPCGLIVNEILTNSIKYAFPNDSTGSVNISFKKQNGEYHLTIFDDGVGLKKDLDIENLQSLGLRLIKLLSMQLRGNVEVIQPEKGLCYKIKFKGIN